MREFETGATRNDDDDRLDYEGFLSPTALRRYAEYMHEHRKQADGKMRASDNWQKGIPPSEYLKSMLRHVIELWETQRCANMDPGLAGEIAEGILCAILFNAFGYLHELTKGT